MRSRPDMRAARAGLDVLLLDASPQSPVELREKVYELARILRDGCATLTEFDEIAEKIQKSFGVDRIPETEIDTFDPRFAPPATVTEIVTDGWFKEYLDYTAELESPTEFHFGAALTAASGAFCRRPLLGWEAVPLYPNIYSLLVGGSGTRKSTAINKAKDIIKEAVPTLNLLPNEGSPQGYASALRRRYFETNVASDGLIIASELKVIIGKDQYKLALGEWLTDWYDNMSDPWQRALKGEETYELPKLYVSFVGGSQMTWLRDIPETLIAAGYLPRHLIFYANQKRHDCANPRLDATKRAALVEKLRTRFESLPEALPLHAETAQLLDAWYLGRVTKQERAAMAQHDDTFGLWLSRKIAHALKVAVVWQTVDGGPMDSLRAEWLLRAIRLVDWMDTGVRDVYRLVGSSKDGATSDAVLGFIERRGGEAMLSQVVRALKNRYTVDQVQGGIKTLVAARLVKAEAAPERGGTLLKLLAP